MQLGNPLTDDYYDSIGLLEYAWSQSVISDDQCDKAKQVCDFKEYNWPPDCVLAMNVVFDKYKEIDIYDISAPICLLNTTSTSTNSVNEVTSFILKKIGVGQLNSTDWS